MSKTTVWKDWHSTPLNNQRPKCRTGSEVLILGKCMHFLRKESLRKELSRRNHSTKTRLSYQWASLNFCHSANTPPLCRFHHTLEMWKPALCTQGYGVQIKAVVPLATQRKRHVGHNDAPPDFLPERPLWALFRETAQCFSCFLTGVQKQLCCRC